MVTGAVMSQQQGYRMPALDVLRGVAILLVMLRHGWPDIFQGAGIVGVVLFFVLSGYLITGVLLKDIDRHGRVRYGRFYAHRAFRLLPALFAFVAVYAAVELATDALGDRSRGIVGTTVVAAVTYIKDLPLPFDVSQAIAPLWTLAVEEQFYLVWPFLLVWAIRRGKPGRLIIMSTVVVFGTMLLTVAAALILVPDKFNHVYSLPTTWGVGLIIGSAAAIFKDRAVALIGSGVRRRALIVGSVAVLAALCFFPNANISPAFYVIGGPAIIITGAILIVSGSQQQSAPAFSAPLLFLGKISYAAYLWNYAVVLWLNDGRAVDAEWWVPWVSIAVTIIIATLSWHTVELAGRRGRTTFDRRYARRQTLPRESASVVR